jgi:putative FmdB family regulatory protein
MATYDYTCENTECEIALKELKISVVQSMSEDALTYCPECKEPTLRRVLGLGGGHRIGGGHNATSMWNVSGDPGPRRKGYDCDPMN